MEEDDDGTSSTSTGSSAKIMSAWRPVTATRRLTSARGPVTEGLEGELQKQSTNFGRVTWNKRYFMIKDGMLMYRKSKEATEVQFLANLMHSKVTPIEVPTKQFCFEVRSSLRYGWEQGGGGAEVGVGSLG